MLSDKSFQTYIYKDGLFI